MRKEEEPRRGALLLSYLTVTTAFRPDSYRFGQHSRALSGGPRVVQTCNSTIFKLANLLISIYNFIDDILDGSRHPFLCFGVDIQRFGVGIYRKVVIQPVATR